MKIYIVTAGTYSDYKIEAVFTTEEKAEAYVDKYGDYDNRSIEEWDTDTENTDKETALYTVRIDDYGTEVERNNSHYKRDTIRAYKCFLGGKIGYALTIETDGVERAKKIASERLMQVKAMPYLFPRLNDECVGYRFPFHTMWSFPTYDFHTKEIILKDREFLRQ